MMNNTEKIREIKGNLWNIKAEIKEVSAEIEEVKKELEEFNANYRMNYRNMKNEEKETARKKRETLKEKIAELDEKKKKMSDALFLELENRKKAVAEHLQTEVENVLKKYVGKRLGEKTKEKLTNELKEVTAMYCYIDAYTVTLNFSNCSYGDNNIIVYELRRNETSIALLDQNNKINDFDYLKASNVAEDYCDALGLVEERQKEMKALEKEVEKLKEKVEHFNEKYGVLGRVSGQIEIGRHTKYLY